MLTHTDRTFVASDSAQRSYRVTRDTAVPTRLIVVMQDGTLSRSEYFDPMASKLAPAGVISYSLPARQIPGKRTIQHAQDLQRMVDIARKQHPWLPVVVMGVSLGAAVTASWNTHFNRRTKVPCVLMSPVLLARMSWFGLRDGAKVGAALVCPAAKSLPVNSPQSGGAVITSNPQSLEWNVHDPTAKVPAGIFADNTRMLLDAGIHGYTNKAPVLILQAGKDAVANNFVSRLWSWSVRGPKKQRYTIPGAAHDLSQEVNHPELLHLLAKWMQQETKAGLALGD